MSWFEKKTYLIMRSFSVLVGQESICLIGKSLTRSIASKTSFMGKNWDTSLLYHR